MILTSCPGHPSTQFPPFRNREVIREVTGEVVKFQARQIGTPETPRVESCFCPLSWLRPLIQWMVGSDDSFIFLGGRFGLFCRGKRKLTELSFREGVLIEDVVILKWNLIWAWTWHNFGGFLCWWWKFTRNLATSQREDIEKKTD